MVRRIKVKSTPRWSRNAGRTRTTKCSTYKLSLVINRKHEILFRLKAGRLLNLDV